MKGTLVATAFAAAFAIGVGMTPVTTTPANAAVTVVVGGKIGGGVVVGRSRLCRHWARRHGRRHCTRWGWRHRVRHCARWKMRHGRRHGCARHRYVIVWR
jgi:hypothetical protein